MNIRAIINRIHLKRESKKEHILPYDNFLGKISSSAELLEFVEENKADKKIRREARKHFIITCVSAMEVYFKRMEEMLVDAQWTKSDFLAILRQNKITLADLIEIKKKKLSLGEIVSSSHSFEDLESINSVFSKILGVTDFIKEVEALKSEVEEEKRIILKNNYPNFRKEIGELVRLRHLLIHHEGFKGIIGLQRLGEMWENLDSFVGAADYYILQKIFED